MGRGAIVGVHLQQKVVHRHWNEFVIVMDRELERILGHEHVDQNIDDNRMEFANLR